MAHQAWEAGSLRVAIVDAYAAVDLAQSVVGPIEAHAERCRLDELRRCAIDIDRTVGQDDAREALVLAEGMIRASSPK
jgi:hypothetical protein